MNINYELCFRHDPSRKGLYCFKFASTWDSSHIHWWEFVRLLLLPTAENC